MTARRAHPGAKLPAAFPAEMNDLSREVLAAAIEVHRHLGPGMLESVYETAFVHELRTRDLDVQHQVPVRVRYKDIDIGGQRLDLIVEGKVIVEIKAVEALLPIHEAQLLSYLKASGLRLGLLVNFNMPRLIEGVKRLVL